MARKQTKEEILASKETEKREKAEERASKKAGGSLLDRLKKASGSEHASVLSDNAIPIRDFISTGNYLLNAMVSGDPFGGVPTGRSVQLVGDKGVGKTYIAMEIAKQSQLKGYKVVIFDTEMANNDMSAAERRGLDPTAILWSGVESVEDLKFQMINMLDTIDPDEKIIMIIDSLGNASSDKEIADSKAGDNKRDMTRAQALKSLFRCVTMKAGYKNVLIVAINHVYAVIGSFIPQTTVAGGSGPAYGTSVIVEFSKAQIKDGDDVTGSTITCKSIKNRMAKERSKVKVELDFNHGISPYSGLLEFCVEEGIIAVIGKIPKTGKIDKVKDFSFRGQDITRKEMTPAFWDTELKGDLGKYLNSKFAYCGAADGILDEDYENEEDEVTYED
jgi:RecA/RadA recombinase